MRWAREERMAAKLNTSHVDAGDDPVAKKVEQVFEGRKKNWQRARRGGDFKRSQGGQSWDLRDERWTLRKGKTV